MRSSFRASLAGFLLAALVSGADAECWVSWNCGGSRGCAQAYGGRPSGRNSVASCAGWKQMDRVSSCSCSSGGSAPASGGAAALVDAVLSGNQRAATMAVGTLGAQMLGAGIGQMLRGDPAAAARERALQAEQARLAQEAAERERRERERRFFENKDQLLQLMNGAQAGAASLGGFKDDDAPAPKPSASPKPDAEPSQPSSPAAAIAPAPEPSAAPAPAASRLGFKDD